jgi:hypothetical protein
MHRAVLAGRLHATQHLLFAELLTLPIPLQYGQLGHLGPLVRGKAMVTPLALTPSADALFGIPFFKHC